MRRLVFAVLLLAVSTPLLAQDWRGGAPRRDRDRYDRRGDSAFELTPFLGYRYGGTLFSDDTRLFGGDVDVASSANFGVNFGIPIGDEGYKLALLVDHQNTNLQANRFSDLFGSSRNVADMSITYFQAGVEVPFAVNRRTGLTPFVSVAAGVANLDPDVPGASAANRFSASASIGLKVPINRNLGLRIEERGFFANTGSYGDDCFSCYGGSDTNLYQGETNVGVVFRF
jgi:hypothetical protein